MRYEPMLASPIEKAQISDWTDWAIEEKFDGHRLVVEVSPANPWKGVQATSRQGKTRELTGALTAALAKLPAGVYDGELMAGETSTDVTRLDLQGDARYVIFDVLEHEGASLLQSGYAERRRLLERIFTGLRAAGPVQLAEAKALRSQDDVTEFVEKVWRRGGEGAILKRRNARYLPGKRTADWIKVKKCKHAVLTVTGFEASKGTKMNRGAFAIARLRDDEGNETTVKVKDDATLADLERAAKGASQHPYIGRRLQIEFQDRTRDGGYRHPRWDRWEDE